MAGALRALAVGWVCATAACTSSGQRADDQAWPASTSTEAEAETGPTTPEPMRGPAPAIALHPGSAAAGSAASSTALSTDVWRLREEKRQLQGAINTYNRQLEAYDRGLAGLRPTPADRIAERRPREDPQDRRRALERQALEDRQQDATAAINRLEYERRIGTQSRAGSSPLGRYRGGLRTR